MKEIQDFISQNELLIKIALSVILLIAIIIIYNLIIKFMGKTIDSSKIFNSKKSKTYIKLIKSINKYIFIFIYLLIVLKIFGVDISSLLAGIGLIGIIIGLAIQDFLKDIIRGTSILSDDYFSVGDIIKYKNIEGKVLTIGLKSTKLQELSTNNIITIPNRNIEDIAVLSKFIFVRVPLPYELKIKEQRNIVNDIVNIVKKDKLIEDCENIGLTELADSKIEYLLKITLNPANKLQARRNVLEHIIEGLEKNNIEVPYNQIDVHQK